MADEEQLRILKEQGVAARNAWRARNVGVQWIKGFRMGLIFPCRFRAV